MGQKEQRENQALSKIDKHPAGKCESCGQMETVYHTNKPCTKVVRIYSNIDGQHSSPAGGSKATLSWLQAAKKKLQRRRRRRLAASQFTLARARFYSRCLEEKVNNENMMKLLLI